VSDIIIKTKTGEVIPAISPEAFGLAVKSMEDLSAQMDELQAKAKKLPKQFESKTQYDEAASLVVQKKSLVKLGEATMLPFVEAVKRVKTFIDQQKNIVANGGTILSGIVEPAMVEWDEREARATAAEQKRVREEQEAKLKREAEEKAQKDREAAEELKQKRISEIREDLKAKRITKRQAEKALREAGALEEAAKAQIAADEEEQKSKAAETAAKTTVKPNTGPTPGLVRRTNFTAVCNDEDLLMHRVVGEYNSLGGKFGPLRDFVMANNVRIAEKARELKDDEEMEKRYPFVKASHTKSF
jgi:hypothetical protein